jgi:Bacterial SH3 domain
LTCTPAATRLATPTLRLVVPLVTALAILATATAVEARPPAPAYAPRVVIVVGPAGSSTRDYLGKARAYEAQARRYGASVTSVLHPHATWDRVVAAAQGANVLIYLGHGNGWPSRYRPFQGVTKNGLGLNPYDGAGAARVRYYGEDLLRAHIQLAPGAVVLLNRLCYASGNAEPGSPEPSWSTAIRRADNFAAGFLDMGASAVLADGHTSLVYELAGLFGRSRSLPDMWTSDPDANGHVRSFASARSPGATVRLDPDRANRGFYRSLVTRPGAATGAIRVAALAGATRARVTLRSAPAVGAKAIGSLPDGSQVVVRGSLATDAQGRTWAAVMTRGGQAGYVAAWLTAFAGSARTRTNVVLRASPSTDAARRGVVKSGVRVTVLRSARDRHARAWLRVATGSGRTGWIAAWLAKP